MSRSADHAERATGAERRKGEMSMSQAMQNLLVVEETGDFGDFSLDATAS
jgi:hypothetical protein